jgi:8-oxo-dGTP diphosphatase
MPHVIASVKALINNNGKYLFLREPLHHGDIWDLPGGKIEYGEEPEDTLVREIKEEVDIDVRITKPVGVWWFYSQNSKHQVICSTFLCEPVDENITIDFSKNPADEHFTEYRWLSASEALNSPDITLTASLKKLLTTVSVSR